MSRWYRNAFNGYLGRIGSVSSADSLVIPVASYDTDVQVDMGATGLAGDWEDVPGFNTSVDLLGLVPVWGFASVTLTSASAGGTIVAIRLVFGTTGEAGVAQQILLSANTDRESLTCQFLATPVSPGLKTVKLQWRRVSGGGSAELIRGTLFVQGNEARLP